MQWTLDRDADVVLIVQTKLKELYRTLGVTSVILRINNEGQTKAHKVN